MAMTGAGLVGVVALANPAATAPRPMVDDPGYVDGLQWHLDAIGAPAAWSSSTGRGVTVAVVDSGVDVGHPDLRGQVVGEVSCIGADDDPARCAGPAADDDGHGTHVAGIIAARANDGIGGVGVAPEARLLAVRVLGDVCGDPLQCRPTGSTADIAAGIRWSVAHGARIVNLSLGATELGPDIRQALWFAWDHGVIPVLASGNGAAPIDIGQEPVVVVTAVDRHGKRPSYAGPVGPARWALAAPGGDEGDTSTTCHVGGQPVGIFSTWWRGVGDGSGYACEAGTSMAAPQVSGGLALLLSMGYSPIQAVHRILDTARPLGTPGTDLEYGAGSLDLAAAVAGPLPPGIRASAAGLPLPPTHLPAVPIVGPLAPDPSLPHRLPGWLVALGGGLCAGVVADLSWRWSSRRRPNQPTTT
ncbi:MAG TPA: S8 family serine peptidase [Acidimicrobiales bacterium]|jgi:subtilisin family serine protease